MKLEDAIDEYTSFVGTPSYAQNVESMFSRVGPFLEDCGVVTVGDITVTDCRDLAKYFARCADSGELAKSSVLNYYKTFRSWLNFCVRDEMIETNPADTNRAMEPLPEETEEKVQQFWSKEDREAILDAVDDHAARAMDQLEAPGWAIAFRDRGLTYTLSYTGTRVTEVVASTIDEDRDGVRWGDVDLEDGTIRVFGKNRKYEAMQLPSPTAAVLEEYKRILAPATEDWPVFPSAHKPKLYQTARQQLADRGLDENEREELLDGREIFDVFREENLVPPSVTDSGWKQGFWNGFVDEYDLYIGGERPEFHAARRGLGDELYRENPRLAQSALRHSDLRTTHKSYSHIKASETAAEVDSAMGVEDPRAFLQDDEESDESD